MTDNVDVPDVEWVFACSTVLGSAHPDTRDTLFMGRVVRYHPNGSLGYGTRWCSGAWLDRHPTRRGNPGRVQGMASHIGFARRGTTLRPYIVVLPDDALEGAARIASDAITRGPGDPTGLSRWAFALVRVPGRTRVGIHMRGPGAGYVTGEFDDAFGVDWRIAFETGGNMATGVEPDRCTIADASGTPLATWSDGMILMEDEPVPDEFIELADRYGNGFAVARELGWKLTLPTLRNRDLEPDERAVARGYLEAGDGQDSDTQFGRGDTGPWRETLN